MNETKQCSKCKLFKDLSQFSRNGAAYKSACKVCRNADAKAYRIANADKLKAKDKRYYDDNKEEHRARMKKYCVEHKDEIRSSKREYYARNRDEILQYHQDTKDMRNKRLREKRETDGVFRVTESLKSRVHYVLRANKSHASSKYIGCSNEYLRKWIEYQFDDQMTWDNYSKVWHIDHVIPISAFSLQNDHCHYFCFHWSNLRPLNKYENMVKADKIVIEDIVKHITTLKSFIQKNGYQTMPERSWWLRDELRYGNNPKDEFLTWLRNEMGNPQPSS